MLSILQIVVFVVSIVHVLNEFETKTPINPLPSPMRIKLPSVIRVHLDKDNDVKAVAKLNVTEMASSQIPEPIPPPIDNDCKDSTNP